MVRVPVSLQQQVGKKHLYRTMEATSRPGAKAEAEVWEAALKVGWAERNGHEVSPAELRGLYQRTRHEAAGGQLKVFMQGADADPAVLGIDHEIEKIAEEVGPEADPSPAQQARLDALQDALLERQGKRVKPRKALELAFSEVADDYMKWWKAQPGLKESNTEQQKRATFRLFSGYWDDRPIRGVKDQDAAGFMDALRHTDPCYARSPKAREMTWGTLQRVYGDRDKGMSPATLNRHAAALKTLWDWAVRRGHCEGLNPFDGHRTRLRRGVNVLGYEPWSTQELDKLLSPPPKRHDLHEVMLVAMLSGMRLNEIAVLTWADVKDRDGISYFDVTDAKTLAGKREVPLHPALSWLLKRRKGANPETRIWSTFNDEGPGKKPGADASREFSYFKQGRGFTDRRKTFHSFRKNAVGQWEVASVPQSEVAEVVGHEKAGITFSVYGGGITLQRKAEIVAMLAYPKVNLRPPEAS